MNELVRIYLMAFLFAIVVEIFLMSFVIFLAVLKRRKRKRLLKEVIADSLLFHFLTLPLVAFGIFAVMYVNNLSKIP